MPELIRLYGEKHDSGFEIVGINLDTDKSRLEEYLEENGVIWPQHYDGKGWDSEISRRFGVDAIPTTFLIDRKGVLRYIDPYGEGLREAVSELLDEKP
jgi:hypothetical protein